MKVSVITIIAPTNYGATLQLYALYRFIKNLGYQVEVIKFNPKYKKNNLKLFTKQKIQEVLLRGRKKKSLKFLNAYIEFTKKTYISINDLKKNPPEADIYVVGSDQVWNSDISNQLEPSYFLDFISQTKKISYASSIGKAEISTSEQKEIKKYLCNFNSISVRESSAKKILENVGLKKIHHVLDPVFLLNRNDYLNLAVPTKEKKYILVYGFESNDVIDKTARKIADEMNLKIIEIGAAISKFNSDSFISNIGPQEFIGLIDGASFVLTSSFHGTALSILFNKKFACVLPSQRSTRIESILSLVKLEDRIIKDYEAIIIDNLLNLPDFEKANNLLEYEIEKSKDFLISSLE